MRNQLRLLFAENKSYGGTLRKTRKGRRGPRPLSTKTSMHLVLRSSKAKGSWSFLKPQNRTQLIQILKKFATKYGIRIISIANVGNHLHLHLKLGSRYTYKPFIRAITGAIAMAVTQTSRWKKLKTKTSDRFWDYRPFTRVIESLTAFLNLRDYLKINKLEGEGFSRATARYLIRREARLSLAT